MSWKRTADAVVIGGGMMGMATAYYLKRIGVNDVVLVEENTPASGSTGRCAASFRAQWGGALNITLGKACIDRFEHLAEHLDINLDIQLYQNGYLLVAYTESQFEQFKKNVELQNSMGVPSKLLNHAEALEICPGIEIGDAVGFSYYKRDGHADPMITNFAYYEAARRIGVRVEKFTKATGFKVGFGHVKGVVTNKGEVDTDIVVNAAGPWAGRVGALAGLNIPVKGERHELMATEPVDFGVCPTMLMSFEPDYYIFQRPHGSILAGCGPSRYRAEAAPFDDYALGASWNFMEHMAGHVNKLIPRARELRVVRQWSGMYDITPDLQPVIGESDELKGFWVNVSGARGFMFGPVAGEMVAEKIVNGHTSLPIDEFHWRRYAEGRFLVEPSVA
ncbi:MAG: FAD-binding oxidoreductase [Synergistaceae bacterium]|jgi:sarcosine oxidase subunit beta|nr:FAD-binding oxidoreductase [Synergistaceae bacterium]